MTLLRALQGMLFERVEGLPFGTGGSRYGPGMTYHNKQHKSHHRLFVATTSQETYDFPWPVDLCRLKEANSNVKMVVVV